MPFYQTLSYSGSFDGYRGTAILLQFKRVEILAGEVSPLQIHQQAKLSLRCFKVLVIYMMMTSMCMHLGPDVLKACKMGSSMPRQ